MSDAARNIMIANRMSLDQQILENDSKLKDLNKQYTELVQKDAWFLTKGQTPQNFTALNLHLGHPCALLTCFSKGCLKFPCSGQIISALCFVLFINCPSGYVYLLLCIRFASFTNLSKMFTTGLIVVPWIIFIHYSS